MPLLSRQHSKKSKSISQSPEAKTRRVSKLVVMGADAGGVGVGVEIHDAPEGCQLILRGKEQQSIGSVALPDGDGQFIKTGKGETGELGKASTLHIRAARFPQSAPNKKRPSPLPQ